MRFPIALAVFSLLPLAGMAQTFDCSTTRFGPDGFVSDKVFLGLDRDANAGSAYDYFINQVHKAPIPVELTKRSETSFQFKWRLSGVTISNEGSGVLTHTVTLNTARQTFTVRGRLHGYENVIRGEGTCTVVK